MNLNWRAATADDEDFLWRVYASSRAEEISLWGLPPQQAEMLLRMQYRARTASYAAGFPDSDHGILLNGEIPVGAAIVARSSDSIRLVDVALFGEFRGSGIGGAFVAQLMQEARERGVPLRLSVLRSNRARNLYARLGFAETAADQMYIEMEYRNA